MKKSVVVIALGTLVLNGCPSNKSAPVSSREGDIGAGQTVKGRTPDAVPTPKPAVTSSGETVATVGGRTISMSQLTTPLVESYGLNTMLNLANLELAKSEAEKRGIVVSTADFEQEREQTIDHMVRNSDALDKLKSRIELADEKKNTVLAAQLREELKQDRSRLLAQLLEEKKVGRGEFEIVLQTNAYLRKIAEPALKGKITDAALQDQFKFQYGEKVKVRHIVLSNPQEAAEARRRLAAGIPFEQVARDMSRNKLTASLGGELPSFSRATVDLSQAFKDAAFLLKPGEISDTVQADGGYHIIKLEDRIAPRVIKFEDVKEGLRADLQQQWLEQTVRLLRQDLSQQVVATLKIENPVLRAQFESKMNQSEKQIHDREQIKREMDKEREKIQQEQSLPTSQPTTAASQPATAPIAPVTPAAQPTSRTAEVVQPPATKPAATPAGTSSATTQSTP